MAVAVQAAEKSSTILASLNPIIVVRLEQGASDLHDTADVTATPLSLH